jgi:hypothetical protein
MCRRLSHAVAPVAHLVLAFAMVFGIVHSGARYFYCEAFGLLPFDPCAEARCELHSKSPSDMLGERPADCCEIVTLAATPQAAQAAIPSVRPAPCVAILPALWIAGRTDGLARSELDRTFGRWRPPRRASNDTRARLMVFLI